MIELTDKITLVEVVWTFVSSVGLGTCIWSLYDSTLDLQAMRVLKQNGLAEMMVWINLRGGIAGITLHLFFLSLGLAAMLTVNQAQRITGDVFAIGFILVAAHNAGTILYNQVARVRIRRRTGATALIVKR